MPNGDLHVHFKKAEVADTVCFQYSPILAIHILTELIINWAQVCRLRAKVYIAGVGSVYLSWYTGKKR